MSTRGEQRATLAQAMAKAFMENTSEDLLDPWLAALDAIGAEGFCVVDIDDVEARFASLKRWQDMIRAGNLAGPEK